MQWGQGGVEQLGAEVQAGSRVLLGFNEPNHGEQAGITPQDAAVRRARGRWVARKCRAAPGPGPEAARLSIKVVLNSPWADS